ncbi:MAG: class I SAM-dependent methyltransferase [Dehalococcoidia bacterium]|jgi:SAM-dependent methyltransferase|nr:class I SAM-dependent methyltransferase [Dehalococcoidia bacterium]MDP7470263.1 class I SAM-dependent methyltransferase [Dehalococcoidia bacterium]
MTGWDSYWATGATDERWLRVDSRVASLSPRLWGQGKRRALDFGCGAGRHTVFLAGQGFQTYACDPSPQAVAGCRRWLGLEGLRARVKTAPANTVPYPNGYLHWAIAFNVVYHNTLSDMEALIHSLRRVIARGGYLFLTLQSTRSYKYGEGEEIEPGTFVNTRDALEHERAVLHHYSDEGEVYRIAKGWEMEEVREMADSYSAPGAKGSYHWYVLLRCPGPHTR